MYYTTQYIPCTVCMWYPYVCLKWEPERGEKYIVFTERKKKGGPVRPLGTGFMLPNDLLRTNHQCLYTSLLDYGVCPFRTLTPPPPPVHGPQRFHYSLWPLPGPLLDPASGAMFQTRGANRYTVSRPLDPVVGPLLPGPIPTNLWSCILHLIFTVWACLASV